MRLILLVVPVPSRAHGIIPGHSLLPAPAPQRPLYFDQRTNTPMSSTPHMTRGLFSAPYRFTPESGYTGSNGPHPQPPSQCPSRVGDNLTAEPARRQPQPSPTQRPDPSMEVPPRTPNSLPLTPSQPTPGDGDVDNDEPH